MDEPTTPFHEPREHAPQFRFPPALRDPETGALDATHRVILVDVFRLHDAWKQAARGRGPKALAAFETLYANPGHGINMPKEYLLDGRMPVELSVLESEPQHAAEGQAAIAPRDAAAAYQLALLMKHTPPNLRKLPVLVPTGQMEDICMALHGEMQVPESLQQRMQQASRQTAEQKPTALSAGQKEQIMTWFKQAGFSGIWSADALQPTIRDFGLRLNPRISDFPDLDEADDFARAQTYELNHYAYRFFTEPAARAEEVFGAIAKIDPEVMTRVLANVQLSAPDREQVYALYILAHFGAAHCIAEGEEVSLQARQMIKRQLGQGASEAKKPLNALQAALQKSSLTDPEHLTVLRALHTTLPHWRSNAGHDAITGFLQQAESRAQELHPLPKPSPAEAMDMYRSKKPGSGAEFTPEYTFPATLSDRRTGELKEGYVLLMVDPKKLQREWQASRTKPGQQHDFARLESDDKHELEHSEKSYLLGRHKLQIPCLRRDIVSWDGVALYTPDSNAAHLMLMIQHAQGKIPVVVYKSQKKEFMDLLDGTDVINEKFQQRLQQNSQNPNGFPRRQNEKVVTPKEQLKLLQEAGFEGATLAHVALPVFQDFAQKLYVPLAGNGARRQHAFPSLEEAQELETYGAEVHSGEHALPPLHLKDDVYRFYTRTASIQREVFGRLATIGPEYQRILDNMLLSKEDKDLYIGLKDLASQYPETTLSYGIGIQAPNLRRAVERQIDTAIPPEERMLDRLEKRVEKAFQRYAANPEYTDESKINAAALLQDIRELVAHWNSEEGRERIAGYLQQVDARKQWRSSLNRSENGMGLA